MDVKSLTTLNEIDKVLKNTKVEGSPGAFKDNAVQIGTFGGRKFESNVDGNTYKFTMKDILKQLDVIIRTTHLDQKGDGTALNNVLIDLKNLDQHGYKLVNEKNIIQKILNAIRGLVGNIGFDKKEIISKFEKLAKEPEVDDGLAHEKGSRLGLGVTKETYQELAEKLSLPNIQRLFSEVGMGSLENWGLDKLKDKELSMVRENVATLKHALQSIKHDESSPSPKVSIKESLKVNSKATNQFLKDFKNKKLDLKKYSLKTEEDSPSVAVIDFNKAK